MLSLASDHAVLIAEFACHLHNQGDNMRAPTPRPRGIYACPLTPRSICGTLGCSMRCRSPARRSAFRIGGFARATAGFIRQTTIAQGILVPSNAVLD
jgi:hypothetical protein